MVGEKPVMTGDNAVITIGPRKKLETNTEKPTTGRITTNMSNNVEVFANASSIPAERGGVFYLEVHPEHARRLRGWPATAGAILPVPFPADDLRRIRLPDGRQAPQ
jgi:hypothetical protein